jgi:hypothetical protein
MNSFDIHVKGGDDMTEHQPGEYSRNQEGDQKPEKNNKRNFLCSADDKPMEYFLDHSCFYIVLLYNKILYE